MKVRTLFVGTSDFVIPVLQKLLDLDFIDVVGIVTQPDKRVGRNQELKSPPIKEWILNNSEIDSKIKIFQPEKLKLESKEIISKINPELIIVASYRQFIPKDMIDYPKFGCLNIHPSILPDLRGAVPIPMAILKGYSETGVTLQEMGEEMDAGDIIKIEKLRIEKDDTAGKLLDKAFILSTKILEDSLRYWIEGKINAIPQNHEDATFCYEKDISKEKAEIDFSKSAVEIDRMVRAFDPWPTAWFEIKSENTSNSQFYGKRVKVFQVEIEDLDMNLKPGNLFKYEKILFIQTGNGVLKLNKIQLEGKKIMSGKDCLFLL